MFSFSTAHLLFILFLLFLSVLPDPEIDYYATKFMNQLVHLTWNNPGSRTWSRNPNVLHACQLLSLLRLTIIAVVSLSLLLLLKPRCYLSFILYLWHTYGIYFYARSIDEALS